MSSCYLFVTDVFKLVEDLASICRFFIKERISQPFLPNLTLAISLFHLLNKEKFTKNQPRLIFNFSHRYSIENNLKNKFNPIFCFDKSSNKKVMDPNVRWKSKILKLDFLKHSKTREIMKKWNSDAKWLS